MKFIKWVFLFVIFIIFILPRFMDYYDYAIDTESFKTDCGSRFDYEQRYDFSTLLFVYEGDCEDTKNQAYYAKPVYAYINHLSGLPARQYGFYAIEVIVAKNSDYTKQVKIIKESVKISISDKSGEIIKSIDPINKDIKPDDLYVKQMYMGNNLPKELIENIYFEVIIDDKLLKIEKTFPVSLQKHYSFWDVLGGI